MPIPFAVDGILGADTETNGLFPRKGDRFYLISFCNKEGETSAIHFPVNPYTREVLYGENKKGIEEIKQWADDKSITKIFHNASFDVRHIETGLGIKIRGPIICTMNLIRLVRSDAPRALKKFCKENLGIEDEDETELKEATRKARREGKTKGYKIYSGSTTDDGSLAPDYWLAPREIVEKYALTDAARAMAVYTALIPEIKKENLEGPWELENRIWKILRKIEKRGIRVFKDKVLLNKENIKKKLQMYQQQAHQIAGKKINLNSSLQLKKIFYERLKEPVKFSTKNGNPSTDVDALMSMEHPLANLILSVRACTKTIEFMDQYLNFMVKHKDGCHYIHPTIHQAMTVTGRESCRDPNLQQVASGRNDKGIEVLVEARSVFGARPGYKMHAYDWKNIEVFIPAFASQEEKIVPILMEGGDVHQITSDRLSNTIGRKISRDQAKRIFFGLLYGIGPKKLGKLLKLDKELAFKIVNGFSEEYPTLAEWMTALMHKAIAEGKIVTPYGRIIYLSQEENYKAPNYYVQGTAGSILKSAKVKIFNTIKKHKWDVHMVLPIHDEILIEMPEKLCEEVDKEVVRCMQTNPELKMPIPIPVSISEIGTSWADKTKIKVV